ncbi:MAG: putative nucleotide-diphospho-sugar transferase [Methylacidiphilales bacterium]|nr:putative nucleotide-diphospho-sugar transferase [Candidatus Methylacidiphilales bacterium]
MQRFVTDFDTNYAAKGIAMLESLLEYSPEAQIIVVCYDETLRGILEDRFKTRLELIPQKTVENWEPRLAPLRERRQPWEFYATHKAILLKHLLSRCADGEAIAFIDADTLFFSDPEPLFQEFEAASIGVSPHRYNKDTEYLRMYGEFNAGFGLWRKDSTGRQCLEEWTEQCLDWCQLEATEDGRFMNQGYLTTWPERYQRVRILRHPGANLAPWNIGSHRIEFLSKGKGVSVDGLPLIFFHYSSLLHSDGHRWHTFCPKKALQQNVVLEGIYAPYLKTLERISLQLKKRYGVSGLETLREFQPDNGGMMDISASIRRARSPWKRFVKRLLP